MGMAAYCSYFTSHWSLIFSGYGLISVILWSCMAVTGFICQSMDHLFHIWSSPTHKHHIFYCRGRTVACIIASKSYLSEHPISEISKRYMLKLGRFFPAPFNIMPGLFIHNCLNIDFKPSNDFHLKIHYFMNKSLCLWFYPDYSQNT